MPGRQKLGDLIGSNHYENVKGDPEDPLHPTAKLKYLVFVSLGRQKLGDLIRSIDYKKVKGDPEDPLHPTAKLKYLKENCSGDLTFDELKDGFAAFEEKVCVEKFPHADQPGFDVAGTTVEILLDLTREFVKSNKGKEKALSEIQFNALAALIEAGPNSSHVGLMWNFTDHAVNLELYFKGLKKKELVGVLKKLYFPINYKRNNACDEKVYYASVCARMEQIYKLISKDQFRMVQREFLRYYNLYNNQIQLGNDDTAKPIYELVAMLMEKVGNPYLVLNRDEYADREIFSCDFNMLMQLCSSIGHSNTQPTIDAARLLLEKLLETMFKNNMFAEVCFFDYLMVAISMLFSNDYAPRQKENLMYDVREILLRGIADKGIPVKPLFNGFMELINKILSRDTVSHESHLVIEDVLTIVVKRAKGLSDKDVKQVLEAVKGIVLSGHRDLVRKLEGVFEALKKQKCLDWKNHIDEALGIINAFGDVTPEHLKRDYDQVFTIAVYRVFLRDFLNMLKQSGILPEVQTNLVVSFFKNVQDTTLLKIPIAQTSANPDFMDFSREKELRLLVLKTCVTLLKNTGLPWDEDSLIAAVSKILNSVATAFKGNGRNVSVEENETFMTIFNKVGDGGESVVRHWYQKDNEGTPNINLEIWMGALKSYVELHQKSATLVCIAPVMPNVIRWAKIAVEEHHDDMTNVIVSLLSTVGQTPPTAFSKHLPDLFELLLKSEKCQGLHDFVKQMYPHNPGAVHDKLPNVFDSLDHFEGTDMANIYLIVVVVSEKHSEVFTKSHIKRMFDRIRTGNQYERVEMLKAMKNIAEKHPTVITEFLPVLCDDDLFDEGSMDSRSSVIAHVGGVNKGLGEKSVAYLMKHALSSSPTTVRIVITSLHSMLKTREDCVQKYKAELEKLEKTTKDSQVKDIVHEMILVLEGKTFENVVGEVQQQKEDIGKLDTKVDATVDTVITIGGKVVEHEREIGELGEGLERVEERVEEVDEGLGETKVKVEEIDKKTMSNAPKWSRDLTKLMNPTAEKDWRLLASRLGYSKADIRAWAQQHDPCMAVLSEWYATHKTSEANYGVLTALTEMNRIDGVAIVENAMKAAEGVVEDEDFEYPHPPAVFISYQWGIQNEVKLLKQHLNMAGYECWMDVGQMGGGDKLFAKIDNGIRGAKIVICCVTEKYAESPNCNREVNLAVNLNKPIIPLLMEKTEWPPKGSMGPIFSEYLFIRFFQRGGEETNAKDKRYWPVPKFQELLMQLNYFVVPDQKMIQKEYKNWWIPMVEDIEIDKNKQKQAPSKSQQQSKSQSKTIKSPIVFLSYQWGKQAQVKVLYKRLTSLGYTVWMDIYQMGGGDSLYDKIDKGMRGCRAVVSCITEKYTLSANCRREVSLADALKKPIIPLLLERMKWPPSGPMSLVFTEMLFINFYRNEEVQMTWKGDNFDELKDQLDQHINEFNGTTKSNTKESVANVTDNSKSNSDTKTEVNDRNKPQKTSAVNYTSSDKRKPEILKRQDAFEESTNVDKRKKEGNDESDQSKSKSCNIL